MPKTLTLSRTEMERLDRYYREGGLRTMASPHVHYDEPTYPHAGCGQRLEWIDFKLELHGHAERICQPLVCACREGTGFVGRCPSCHGWVHFSTLEMTALEDDATLTIPQLPENWASVAQIA